MFNCYIHGWSSYHSACPLCFTTHTYTSSETTIHIEESSLKEIQEREHRDYKTYPDGVYCLKCGKKLKPKGGWEEVSCE